MVHLLKEYSLLEVKETPARGYHILLMVASWWHWLGQIKFCGKYVHKQRNALKKAQVHMAFNVYGRRHTLAAASATASQVLHRYRAACASWGLGNSCRII